MDVVCEHCGTVAAEGDLICRACGAMLPVRDMYHGAAAIRQGRGRSQIQRYSVGSERRYAMDDSEVLDDSMRAEHAMMGKQTIVVHKPRKRLNVNWAMLFTVLFALLIVAAVGGFVYLRLTSGGQRIMARMGYEADATAMWEIGAEYMDHGYVERAILIEEEAYAKDPEREDIYDRLLQLCEAYEAAERPEDAERLYVKLYSEVDKTNPVAYQNILRLMRDQGRTMEAAEFLKIAYANTNLSAFETERLEMIPASPTISEKAPAGRHKRDQYVELISPEGNDIYYVIGDTGLLPEDGTLYTSPIHLGEGGWTIRAVCVSTELVSDELSAKYVITYPSPDAPKASLAPGTYNQRQRLRLRNVGTDKNVTFYYTIDGTPPTINSPIYNPDEGILLPGGLITVKAVAVNSYGKVSNVMSVELKINNVPFKMYYRVTDTIAGSQLMKTNLNQFKARYGQPIKEEPITDTAIQGTCSRLIYSWGEARFYVDKTGTLLYYIDTNASMDLPRGTKIGMKEAEITAQFQDLGQAANQDGSRSLYYNSNEGCYGRINLLSNGQKRIDYIHVDSSVNATITLSYYLDDGVCSRVVNSFVFN